ncbi:hypothetical protein GETHLI_25920 [Geothrix limicola]|uniref:Uncharacterized protein n=1 Tax=Geothrix limicola TaxID=2927978 RepID=A0ABQ5QIS3_9BACT|nr:hypothetical protein [Geothrix limicola]GLH74090.1 hypothetical protein GETHLI_25920 [Geothrix limicola]
MLTLLLAVPALVAQAPAVPLPELEAKDLAAAPRGPMTPQGRDAGADRDIMGQARMVARRGPSIPALQLPAGSCRVKDKVPNISGWRAYAIEVPGGGSVKVHVVEGRKAWFRVLGVNAWGRLEEGLLQNRIPTGEPMATYKNPAKEARTVYFIVDSLDENMIGDPFTVEVTRQ